jgi:hypothetical protein
MLMNLGQRDEPLFGTYTQIIWSEDGEPIPETHGEKGLIITQILSTEPPE